MPRAVKSKRRWMPKGPVNVHEAKTHYSQLLEHVGRGHEVVLAKAGQPVAKLVPIDDQPRVPKLGAAKHLLWVADDIDKPLPDDVIDLFYNSSGLEPYRKNK